MKLIYCDYIASLTRHSLAEESNRILSTVSGIKYDLGAHGELVSTKKMIFVTDKYGTNYRITIEEN